MAEMLEVHVNFGEANEASAVAREAVEQRLAACANIHGPIRSLYWWDGAVQKAVDEFIRTVPLTVVLLRDEQFLLRKD